jgi:ArsR family transcriptional regulator
MKKLEMFFKLLADGNRLRILQTIGKDERSVSEIIERTGLSQTLVSFHLRVMREARLVTASRRGPFIYYRLSDPSLLNLLEGCGVYASELGNNEDDERPAFQWPPWRIMCRGMG